MLSNWLCICACVSAGLTVTLACYPSTFSNGSASVLAFEGLAANLPYSTACNPALLQRVLTVFPQSIDLKRLGSTATHLCSRTSGHL